MNTCCGNHKLNLIASVDALEDKIQHSQQNGLRQLCGQSGSTVKSSAQKLPKCWHFTGKCWQHIEQHIVRAAKY